ncbi:MAG: hypothetical protein IPL12_11235 [Bacteroidetes bacterium]|nr:hypothetical protein [Bacteroidota bacterium]
MEGKEKQIVVTLINTIIIFGCYILYVYNTYLEHDASLLNDNAFWGKTFLIFIPVAIVAQIVLHIVFAIINGIVTKEQMSSMTDERDKLIELKAIRISHWIFTFGFLIAMGSQAMGMETSVMFATLVTSGFLSAIISESAKIYFYRKGV